MPKKGQARANNGMGSVRQRSDGRWEARYTAPNGEQKSVYGKTEREVTAKLRTVLHDIDMGSWHEPSRMTVEEWIEIWLTDYQSHAADGTIRTYDSIARNHIVPTIGKIRMSNLSQIHVRRVITGLSNASLSANYIKQCRIVLSAAFKAAVEAGILRTNPVFNVKTPRIVKQKLTIVDREMFPSFINACENHSHGKAFLFMLLTGLRAGEMRALCWADVDFASSNIEVNKQIPMIGKVEFSPPKYGSVRTIEMPPEAMELLRRQKKDLAAMRLAAGQNWKDNEITSDLVFRSACGGALNKRTIDKTVKAIGAEIGLPSLHAHDLRHSYAVAALRSGIDIKTVQNNMGHLNAAVTLNTYAAYTQDAGKVGAVKFSNYWQDAILQNPQK